MPPTPTQRSQFLLQGPDAAAIALQMQAPTGPGPRADVLYVHGSSFGADLSIYFAFDGRSWADHLAEQGHAVWGFDFVGYGRSARYAADLGRPAGDIDDAARDLGRVVVAVRERNGGRPLVLLAHSRGGLVAARHASEHPDDVAALVLFAPVVTRPGAALSAPAAAPAHFPLSAWAQYRRFVQDVPRHEPQVLSEAHMQAWADAFLASDPGSGERRPPSVMTPAGPVCDIDRLWSGQWLFEPGKVVAPTLLVRGEWDSLCDDADARRLLDALHSAPIKDDVKLPRATHLMHLEAQRTALYAEVHRLLDKVLR